MGTGMGTGTGFPILDSTGLPSFDTRGLPIDDKRGKSLLAMRDLLIDGGGSGMSAISVGGRGRSMSAGSSSWGNSRLGAERIAG